jgi:hypothetical protein
VAARRLVMRLAERALKDALEGAVNVEAAVFLGEELGEFGGKVFFVGPPSHPEGGAPASHSGQFISKMEYSHRGRKGGKYNQSSLPGPPVPSES